MRIWSMAEMPVRPVEIWNTGRCHIFKGLRVLSRSAREVGLI
jgi:hypothetical protein